MRRLFILGCLLGVACGGEDKPQGLSGLGGGPSRPPTGGRANNGDPDGGTLDGGAGGTDGGGGGDSGPVNLPGAPTVTITSPVAATDPDVGPVIVQDQIEVLCTAVPSSDDGAAPVDPSTVTLELIDGQGTVVGDAVPGVATDNPGEYAATFILSTIPTGPVSFRCSASDGSPSALTGSGTVGTFVDHGPTIETSKPVEDVSVPLAGAVPFEFSVLPAPLADGDDGALVTSVTLKVNGIDLALQPPNENGTYTLPVDFKDTETFPNTPSGPVQVEIRSENARGVESAFSYYFTVDGAGPSIAIKNIPDAAVIGGRVTLRFTVTDALSDVDPESVVVKLNGVEHRFDPVGEWTRNDDEFSFTFDSRNLGTETVQLTINIAANDSVGNQAEGEAINVYLDNVAPIVDLDPENVREWKESGSTTYCSASFDPVGVSPNDLATVPAFATFRALAWDLTNSLPGQTVLHHAGTDPNSVFLYMQPATATPLLIDADDDPGNVCDEIADRTTLPLQDLAPITPSGGSWYGNAGPTDAPLPPDWCVLDDDPTPPKRLCTDEASDLTRVISHGDVAGTTPVIYGIPPLEGVLCTGDGWAVSSYAEEGWVCLAARAVDEVGNVGISPPLRICYDHPLTAFKPACASDPSSPPSCTDGCTPPAGFGAAVIKP